MSDMTVAMLVMAGFAVVVAVSWQLAEPQQSDAIDFVTRLGASIVIAAIMAALLYGLVFMIALTNIAGRGDSMDMILHTSFWMSVGIAFVKAISPGEDRKPALLRFIARWIWTWVRVVADGILLALGFCTVTSSV